MEKIKEKIQTLIAYLIYDLGWDWLHLVISTLADLEMNIALLRNPEFKHEIDICDFVISDDANESTPAEINIPKQTFYCNGCVYGATSKVARTLLGKQCCGYCYYIGKGDYSFTRSTATLWDGCKECGRYEFFEDED